ncbi:hypothetical protein TREMEDRAFT_61532 [Tremella mesenterica DSM 1558]|uniref:uncharacterized protein n=1 Tax=Tremella mesenterica (strain ATCC 24925 / CBS 8224 / DSM 1558 / NBRC 9311 / NRRL Y-6157 / RJB 2259-6 / UBC 559-6) TaxID=578456 RepID=UPI0003F4A487|nr:uncharacterized protein TREMEDRAFT_61532 [Tremella mesenterica DSM 1558]EIW69767.1 hypothetical protein TREMEDRAFT_61532 [Tremella mesenterica DSM 1558]
MDPYYHASTAGPSQPPPPPHLAPHSPVPPYPPASTPYRHFPLPKPFPAFKSQSQAQTNQVDLTSPPPPFSSFPPHEPLLPTRAPRTRPKNRGGGRGRGQLSGPRSASARQSTRISSRPTPVSGGGGNAGVSKLKLSFKASGSDPSTRKTSFLGEYDRELDDDPNEPLCFEEQWILRVPKEVAEGPNGLREIVKGKGKGMEGVEFKFLDSRRATFKFNGVTYASKLVDLPSIIESQKTHDNRHLFKVADISQMLVVTHPVKDESTITSAPLKIDDFIWPHGITPPLRHVRKRRFRKRISRRTIEVVEEQVEELLKRDKEADESTFDLIEALPDPEAPDQYYIDYDSNVGWVHPEGGSEMGESEMYEDPGSVAQSMGEWEDGTEGEGEYEEDGLDRELANMLREEMNEGSDAGASGSEGEDEDEDEEAAGGTEDEDDEETAEKKAKIRQFTSEIKNIEATIERKRAGFTGGNPIMQKRFEETLAGLLIDVVRKAEARRVLQAELDAMKRPEQSPKIPSPSPISPVLQNIQTQPVQVEEGEDEDLFGDADAEGEEEVVQLDTIVPIPDQPKVVQHGPVKDPIVTNGVDEGGVEGGVLQVQNVIEEEDYEGERDMDDDEMAAMLEEELARPVDMDMDVDMGVGVGVGAGVGVDGAGEGGESDQILNTFVDPIGGDFGDSDGMGISEEIGNQEQQPKPPNVLGSFQVEGGVGRRRLAVEEEEDDDSDSDGDDSDD